MVLFEYVAGADPFLPNHTYEFVRLVGETLERGTEVHVPLGDAEGVVFRRADEPDRLSANFKEIRFLPQEGGES